MRLTLPVPPPGNHYKKLRVVHGRPCWYLTARAKQFFSDVRKLGAGLQPLEGPVRLTVRIFRPQKRGDWDGFVKCTCDALQGLAYGNDSQIVEAHVYRDDDKANPRVEVEVVSADETPKPMPKHVLPSQGSFTVVHSKSDLPMRGRTDFALLATPNYRAPTKK